LGAEESTTCFKRDRDLKVFGTGVRIRMRGNAKL